MRALLVLFLPVAALAQGLELVETAPVETTLDHADLREAADVWREMIDGARSSIDLCELYATSAPDSRLEPVIAALGRAAARGVKVRFLVDAGFARDEPATVEALEKMPGIALRRLEWGARGGGVLHAKYFVVDGREAFVGSQNFDWRALTHIQELGVRVRVKAIAAALEDLYERDWRLASGVRAARATRWHFPVVVDGARVTLVGSPRGWLPDERMWDLPMIVGLIDAARRSVRVQLLTYRGFDPLEPALRRAAARGVEVSVLVSDWSKRPGTIESLREMARVPHVSVEVVTIPEARAGFIPYARTVHAKYMVVDGGKAWIGTSNWERDYFFESRNVGLIVEGGEVPRRLERFFEDDWRSGYATRVDPAGDYTPPRIH